MTYLHIGGQERPIRFGMGVLMYDYPKHTGRSALEDFGKIANQPEGEAEDISMVIMIDLVFCGLIGGAKKLSKPIDFDETDVAEWLFANQSIIPEVMKLFTESLPEVAKNAAGPAKPKAKAAR